MTQNEEADDNLYLGWEKRTGERRYRILQNLLRRGDVEASALAQDLELKGTTAVYKDFDWIAMHLRML